MGLRGSLKAANMVQQTGFGKQEGIAKVEDARFIAVQHVQGEKKGGGLVTPFLALQFDEIYVDSDHKPVDDAGVEQVNMIVCWGDGKTKEAKFRFQPAVIKSADDQEPVEVGTSDIDGDDKMKLVEIGAEGNTFVSTDGAVPFANSDIGIFMASLEKAGWKPEVNDQGYSQNYVGLIYEFKTVEKAVLCKELGIKYESRKVGSDGKVPQDVCRKVTKILVRPYEVAAKGGAKGGAKASAGKAGAVAAGTTTAAAADTVDDTVDPKIEASAMAAVAKLKGKTLVKKDFIMKIAVHMMSDKSLGATPSKVATSYTNQLKKLDDDEFAIVVMSLGGSVEDDKVSVE